MARAYLTWAVTTYPSNPKSQARKGTLKLGCWTTPYPVHGSRYLTSGNARLFYTLGTVLAVFIYSTGESDTHTHTQTHTHTHTERERERERERESQKEKERALDG